MTSLAPCQFVWQERKSEIDRTETYSPAAQGGGGLRRGFLGFLFSLTRLIHLPGEQAGVEGRMNPHGWGGPCYGDGGESGACDSRVTDSFDWGEPERTEVMRPAGKAWDQAGFGHAVSLG